MTFLAAFAKFSLETYLFKIPVLVAAYFAAINLDSVFVRIGAFAYLTIFGAIVFGLSGFVGGSILYAALGILSIAGVDHARILTRAG